jgi:hypothetical protein
VLRVDSAYSIVPINLGLFMQNGGYAQVTCYEMPMSAMPSNPEVELADADFRFTSQSRPPAAKLACPFGAKGGVGEVDAVY